MNCPYCSREMDPGYIKSSQVISWGKDRSLGFHPEDLKFNKKQFLQGFFEGFFVTAYHCKACKKIIIAMDAHTI